MSPEAAIAFTKASSDIRVPSRYRASWVLSSVQTLRHRNHYDAYREHLSEAERHEIDAIPVVGWVPARVLMSHYAACDKLGLRNEEVVQMGLETTRLALGNTFRIAARAATGVGVTSPWSVLDQLPKHFARVADGGGIEVLKVGPKEARVGVFAFPPARYQYNRQGMRGILEASMELFCSRIFVTLIPAQCTDVTLVFRIAWV